MRTHYICVIIIVVITAQTEGDTGYDYDDAYDDSFDDTSGRLQNIEMHLTLKYLDINIMHGHI